MPIATPEVYAEMLGRAKENAYAFPAINCTSSETVNAAIKGFADAGSDGIIQFSTGGAEFASGLGVKDMVTGAVALAKFTRSIAAKYPINVALHTDHCPKDKLDTYVRPLLAISAERVAAGKNPLFQSHMWDGSAVPIDENLAIAKELLKEAAAAKIILEVEIGVVGGEEDGVEGAIDDKLYTTPEDFEKTIDALGHGEHGKYLLAATFGNVHGVYKPGNVKLRPDILDQGQKVAVAKLGLADGAKPFDFVFHGGSGSLKSEIEEALRYGVVKMNVDTDTQYAFTRPLAGHMFSQLRRRAQGRRRGRQQEGLRPAQLPEEGRSLDDRARHRGLQRPALRREDGRQLTCEQTQNRPFRTDWGILRLLATIELAARGLADLPLIVTELQVQAAGRADLRVVGHERGDVRLGVLAVDDDLVDARDHRILLGR